MQGNILMRSRRIPAATASECRRRWRRWRWVRSRSSLCGRTWRSSDTFSRTTQPLVSCVTFEADRHNHLTAFFLDSLGQASTREVEPVWILMEQEVMRWQWHQVYHMQIICSLLQTNNHISASSLNCLQAGCSSWFLKVLDKSTAVYSVSV